MDDVIENAVKIIVIGVGGGGCNAVNRMVDENTPVEFYVMNTDLQSLNGSRVPANHRLILGKEITGGFGVGGDPELGKRAAEASAEEIRKVVKGANMVFLAAGMGGGTGTGATPVIASICKEEKALTVAVVTRPFDFEGKTRLNNSVSGISALKENVDSIIFVSNNKLLMNNGNSPISEAFSECDKVLAQSVRTITDLILMPGIINLDFADIRHTLHNSGIALIGYGIGSGPTKASDAANLAMSSPLLDTVIKGARRAICAITCGADVPLFEAHECVKLIVQEAGDNIDVKLGISINDQLSDQIIVSLIASDFSNEAQEEITKEGNNPTIKVEANDKINVKENEKQEEEDILPDFLKGKNID